MVDVLLILSDARLHLLDLVTMAAMGAIGLGVYEANPAPTRNFPIFNNNSEVVYPEYVLGFASGSLSVYLLFPRLHRFAYPVSAKDHVDGITNMSLIVSMCLT